ncbi:MAG: hypothetical protein KDH20_10665 [Rhodocyclaceae bacterium]|nr:hypothetical protein [Rhodocyclaceae bacterium]
MPYRCAARLLAGALGLMGLAQPGAADVLDDALAAAGVSRPAVTLPRAHGPRAGLPLTEAMLSQPLDAAYRAGLVEAAAMAGLEHVPDLVVLASSLLEAEVAVAGVPAEGMAPLLAAADPLAAAFDALAAAFGGPRPTVLPDESVLARPLRIEIGHVLLAIVRAERFRRRALSHLPASLDRPLVLRQALAGRSDPFETPDLRLALGAVDYPALAAGMQGLALAMADLRAALATGAPTDTAAWEVETALGRIVIDLGGRDDRREMAAPLLLVDLAGDDTYRFVAPAGARPISLLLDLAGQDRYEASTAADGVAAGVLGFGLQWDAGSGADRYEGGDLDQAGAILGAAVLVDEGGDDRYRAVGHAQAFAMGGLALLFDGGGEDRFEALTQAQASAGPRGVALLVDRAGNDHYRLAATPLVAPSAQRPSVNVSAGQGMGIGIRADHIDGRSLAGGVGVLLDGGGDDDYEASVFAQGAGYWRGTGLLIDRAGADRYQSLWYGQGAAAHDAVGVLIDRGDGDDRHEAEAVTSLAAAHDGSVAILVNEAGNDDYRLGDLGLGAANDTGVAVFADLDGDDAYAVAATACRAFGAAPMAAWGSSAERVIGLGLFFDLGGDDRYPCDRPAEDRQWRWPRAHAGAPLPSEAGVGMDGEAPWPFATGPMTARSDGAPKGAPLWRADPRYRVRP